MNMFALVQLQKLIAEAVARASGFTVKLGRYVHQADSYHIYGSYFNDFKQRFLGALASRPFEERSYRYEDVRFMMDDAIPAIRKKAAEMGREG